MTQCLAEARLINQIEEVDVERFRELYEQAFSETIDLFISENGIRVVQSLSFPVK